MFDLNFQAVRRAIGAEATDEPCGALLPSLDPLDLRGLDSFGGTCSGS